MHKLPLPLVEDPATTIAGRGGLDEGVNVNNLMLRVVFTLIVNELYE
jgi:hypothetical protein